MDHRLSLEGSQFSHLVKIDCAWRYRAIGEINHDGPTCGSHSIDLLDSSRGRFAGVTAQPRPEHAKQNVAVINQLLIQDSLWAVTKGRPRVGFPRDRKKHNLLRTGV